MGNKFGGGSQTDDDCKKYWQILIWQLGMGLPYNTYKVLADFHWQL